MASRRRGIGGRSDEGRIDAVTALEYRVMAMFGLPDLPQVFSHDPRFARRSLTGLYISAFAKAPDRGGTCGHTVGYVDDAFPPMDVALHGCDLEILNNAGTWHGECSSAGEVNPGTGKPYSEVHWVANLEQTSPRETPSAAP